MDTWPANNNKPLPHPDESLNPSLRKTRHCLTFDVEEHFQVSAFDTDETRKNWSEFESRVERNTDAILELLEEKNTEATFFVLGWVAERHPGLVRKIADAHHEIASHGYAHELVTLQSRSQFEEDARKSKGILENLTGRPVEGYRAPSFTIMKKTTWALSILAELGYSYDSSIFPIRHDRYGFPGAVPTIHRMRTSAGLLWEVPPSTVSLAGLRVPVAGGGYFRLVPYSIMRQLLKRADSSSNRLVMYLHPWELDPDQPRMKGPLISRFRHYLNLHKTRSRLSLLLDDFEFGPVSAALKGIKNLEAESLILDS